MYGPKINHQDLPAEWMDDECEWDGKSEGCALQSIVCSARMQRRPQLHHNHLAIQLPWDTIPPVQLTALRGPGDGRLVRRGTRQLG